MAFAIEWQSNIEIELEKMKQELSKKADRVTAEQISRQQDEKISKLRNISPEFNVPTPQQRIEIGPERVCSECVEIGDLNTAFSTILSYIDTTAETKAERKDVNEKATIKYSNQLYDRLSIISQQQLTEVTDNLQKVLDEKISGLIDQFNFIRDDINQRVKQSEYNIYQLNKSIEKFANFTKKRQPRFKMSGKIDLELNKTYQFNNCTKLAPRRLALRRSFVKSQKEILESFRANRPEPEKVPYSVVKIKKKTKNT